MVAMISLLAGCGGEDWKKPTAAPEPASGDAAQPAPDQPAAPTRVKAAVGVGAKGHDYGEGIVATPIAAYFSAKERIAFDIQIPQAMQVYKATHDGHGPKTHEEFMKDIIQENRVVLPALRPGDRYLYDPAQEELMVEKHDGRR